MGTLHRGGGDVRFVHRRPLLRSRLRFDPVGTVEAGPVYGGVVDDNSSVNVCVVDNSCVHVGDCRVIGKMAAFPPSAPESHAHISETVIHSAIEADVRAPIAAMPTVNAARKSPIPGGPQNTSPGGKNPCARHPEVPVGA